eukprot:2739123-Amphidinium_carterae.1
MQAPQRKVMTNILPGSSETQNISDGCSAAVIQAGGCCGLAKWLPISARDLSGVTSRCRGKLQEKSLA